MIERDGMDSNFDCNSESFHRKHEYYTEYLYDKEELPHRYVFVLTNQCNLRCPFCYQKKGKVDSILSKSEWISILDQLPKYARVTLTGGEPLLHPDFQEIFSEVAKRFQCNLITNGLLLNKEIINFLLSFDNFSVLSISIDSIKKKIRPLSSDQVQYLEEIFYYFLKTRDEIGSHAILDLKTLILNENSIELFDIHLYCTEKIQCDHHTLQFLKGSPIQHSDEKYNFCDLFPHQNLIHYENLKEIYSQLKKIQNYRCKSHSKTFLHPVIISFMNEEENISRLEKLEYSPDWKNSFYSCKYPWSSIHINYDGTVFPCLAIPIGNLKEKSLNNIIKSEKFREFKRLLKEESLFEACYRCGWLKLKVDSEDE